MTQIEYVCMEAGSQEISFPTSGGLIKCEDRRVQQSNNFWCYTGTMTMSEDAAESVEPSLALNLSKFSEHMKRVDLGGNYAA